ncbi:MAG: hypothetical protein IKR42_06475 [Campylobacter sp.]|nr:hypothetical protein [Campylobacter sp.]
MFGKKKKHEYFKSKIVGGITIRELSVGLIYRIEEKLSDDKITTILAECSDLSKKEIANLGFSFAKSLYDEILKLTYGEVAVQSKDSDKKKIAYFVSLAVKFGFKNALKMPFNMFKSVINQVAILQDEEYKNLALWLRAARFCDNKDFKALINKKIEKNEITSDEEMLRKFEAFNKGF